MYSHGPTGTIQVSKFRVTMNKPHAYNYLINILIYLKILKNLKNTLKLCMSLSFPDLSYFFFLIPWIAIQYPQSGLTDEQHIPANRFTETRAICLWTWKDYCSESRYLILQELRRTTLKPQGRIACKIPLNWVSPLYNHKQQARGHYE